MDPVERETGIEPATPSLARRCSTAEPLAHFLVLCAVPYNGVYIITLIYGCQIKFYKFSIIVLRQLWCYNPYYEKCI